MRYPPYTPKKLEAYRKFIALPSPNFGRDGKPLPQPFWLWALLLGAHNKKGGAFRYLVVLVGK